MAEAEKPTITFINPGVEAVLRPKVEGLKKDWETTGSLGKDKTMRRALGLRHAIKDTADELATHPLIILKELMLGETTSALKAREIEEKRVSRYGYVGDIHGLSDADFAKLRETLVRENFDQIFFMGDIGGSDKLTKLQRLFYNGGPSASDNLLWNRYKQLVKAGTTDDETLLKELKQGYLNLAANEKTLAQEGLTEEQAKTQVSALTDEQILQGVKWTVKHEHYGHYASDLSDDIKKNLAKDVEHYYARFSHMVAELRLHTKAKVYALQGNWDARLPIDFKPNTEHPEPLPENERIFNVNKFFQDSGIAYFRGIGVVEDNDSVHILVPFDVLTQEVGKDKLAGLKKQITAARKKGKTVLMVTHAVPAWQEAHNKPSTGEGQITEKALRELLGSLDPDEVVYGHEHFIRKDPEGKLLLNTKYRVIKTNSGTVIGQNEEIRDLTKTKGGVIATHIPIPGEPFNGVASVEIPKLAKDKSPRGRTGLREPVRVGGNAVPQRRIGKELPGEADVLHTQIDPKTYIRNPYAQSPTLTNEASAQPRAAETNKATIDQTAQTAQTPAETSTAKKEQKLGFGQRIKKLLRIK